MSRPFVRAEPLQAGKLAAIVAVLVFAVGGYFRLIPGQQLAAFLLVTVSGLGLALVVTAETLLAGYRAIRTAESRSRRFDVRPAYTAVRAGEAVVALLAAGVFIVTIDALPDEPMAGPGAFGLLLFGVGLGLSILVASLVRTVVEYYSHRHGDPT